MWTAKLDFIIIKISECIKGSSLVTGQWSDIQSGYQMIRKQDSQHHSLTGHH
jgi:hypothetical protein